MPFTLLKPDGIDLSQTFAFTGSVTGAGGGKIGQVQSTTLATEQSSTSDSFVDTNLTVNITPSSSSNKILVMVAHGMNYTASGTESRFKLVRDTTDIDEYIVNLGLSGSGGGSCINYLDTPNKTTQTTYYVRMRRNSGSGAFYMCANDTVSTITAMEILS
tara:strand:+ start:13 stop:492 length:480 start_codon:yes stop_codon:yes gene_type:complete